MITTTMKCQRVVGKYRLLILCLSLLINEAAGMQAAGLVRTARVVTRRGRGTPVRRSSKRGRHSSGGDGDQRRHSSSRASTGRRSSGYLQQGKEAFLGKLVRNVADDAADFIWERMKSMVASLTRRSSTIGAGPEFKEMREEGTFQSSEHLNTSNVLEFIKNLADERDELRMQVEELNDQVERLTNTSTIQSKMIEQISLAFASPERLRDLNLFGDAADEVAGVEEVADEALDLIVLRPDGPVQSSMYIGWDHAIVTQVKNRILDKENVRRLVTAYREKKTQGVMDCMAGFAEESAKDFGFSIDLSQNKGILAGCFALSLSVNYAIETRKENKHTAIRQALTERPEREASATDPKVRSTALRLFDVIPQSVIMALVAFAGISYFKSRGANEL